MNQELKSFLSALLLRMSPGIENLAVFVSDNMYLINLYYYYHYYYYYYYYYFGLFRSPHTPRTYQWVREARWSTGTRSLETRIWSGH